MIKTITKIGNSRGIIFDAALLEQAGLKEGDKVNVTVHEGGTITLQPDVEKLDEEVFQNALEDVLADYSDTLKKLS